VVAGLMFEIDDDRSGANQPTIKLKRTLLSTSGHFLKL